MSAKTLSDSSDPEHPEFTGPTEEFLQLVRDGLASLYDLSILQENPIAQEIAPGITGVERVRAVRQAFLDAIEQINLTPTGDRRQHYRPYRILIMKFVEEATTRDILRTLSLSERQFYRELSKAINAVGQVLWSQLQQGSVDSPAAPFSIASEMTRAYDSSAWTTIDAKTLIEGVVKAVSNLASQHEVAIEAGSVSSLSIRSNPPVLRQALILLLQQIVTSLPPQTAITIETIVTERTPAFTFRYPTPAETHRVEIDEVPALSHLIGMLSLTVQSTHDAAMTTLRLVMPVDEKHIVIIDDNPMIVDLLRRYLSPWNVSVSAADNGARGLALVRQIQPLVVILDVMLPGKDGWEVLQTLKTHPDTRQIPVLVCSVLNASELALSLGADGFLGKPPNRAKLMTFLGGLIR